MSGGVRPRPPVRRMPLRRTADKRLNRQNGPAVLCRLRSSRGVRCGAWARLPLHRHRLGRVGRRGQLLTRDEANTRALPRVVAGALRLVLALRLCRCGHRFCYEHSHPHPQGRFYKKFEHPVCPTRKQFRDFSTDIVFALIS